MESKEFEEKGRPTITITGLDIEFLYKPKDTIVETYIEEIVIPLSILEEELSEYYDLDNLVLSGTDPKSIKAKQVFKYPTPMLKTNWQIYDVGETESFITGAYYIGHQNNAKYMAVSKNHMYSISEGLRPIGTELEVDTDFTLIGTGVFLSNLDDHEIIK